MLNEVFLNRMKEYLGHEFDAFLDSFNDPNIRALQVNNSVISNEEFKRIFDLEIAKIPYLDNGFYLMEENVKLGFHPLHHAGAFYMQDPSAMSVVESVDFPDNLIALDLCAAPGGKTIQLANKLSNGIVVSNEIDSTRAKALYSNVERMNLSNVVVTNNHPKDFLKHFEGVFDLVLVDAPCSGEGMFRKYPESQELWTLDNVQLCHNRDIEIIDIAISLLKKGGLLIYSTCTFAKEENEDIVSYVLENYDFTQIDIKENLKSVLKEGFIPKTYRVYPHLVKGEGQFLAVLLKESGDVNSPRRVSKFVKNIELESFMKKSLSCNLNNVIQKGDNLFYSAIDFDISSLKVLNYGVKLGEIFNKRFIPNHNFFKAFSDLFVNHLNLDFKDELVRKYLHGEQIQADVDNGFGVLTINGVALGGFKATNNNLNNYYPKGLRNF